MSVDDVSIPSNGLAPLAAADARLLILGSLPSVLSLRLQQYYAHPRNAFWPIMDTLFGAGPDLPYAKRVQRLTAAGVAVWDVLASSVRPGSMDADIDLATAQPNAFAEFFETHAGICTICFNGRAAEKLFARLVDIEAHGDAPLDFLPLPSTSPANAALSVATKLERWKVVQSCVAR